MLFRKRRVSEYKRIELERRISKDEYLNLIMNADTSLGRIRKDRYCLTYNNQSFQIDVYPFWTDKAVAEIELRSEDQEIRFPEFINVIREVTGEKGYTSAGLARIL